MAEKAPERGKGRKNTVVREREVRGIQWRREERRVQVRKNKGRRSSETAEQSLSCKQSEWREGRQMREGGR